MFQIIIIVVVIFVVFKIVKSVIGKAQDNDRINVMHKNAEQCDTQAQYELALSYRREGKYDEAVSWFKRAAENGYVKAQFELGMLYKKDNEISKNLDQAVYWFRKAADQGIAKAHYELVGKGNELNYGISWLMENADQQNAESQYYLGLCYMRGNGITENKELAISWFEKAIVNGSINAQSAIGFIDIEENQKFVKNSIYWLVKKMQYDLVKAGYYLQSSIYGNEGASILVNDEDTDKWVGTITMRTGTRVYERNQILGGQNNRENKMTILDEAHGLIIYSKIPSEPNQFPKWLVICAKVIKSNGIRISDPGWIHEYPVTGKYPGAEIYINSVLK